MLPHSLLHPAYTIDDPAGIQSAQMCREAAAVSPQIEDLDALLQLHTALSEQARAALDECWRAKNAALRAPALSLQLGSLLDIDWKLGLAVQSSTCKVNHGGCDGNLTQTDECRCEQV